LIGDSPLPGITNVDALTLDIDERLADLREEMFEAWAEGNDTIEFAAACCRVAYGRGMTDALSEPGRWRKWRKSHGFRVPYPKKGKSANAD